MVNILLDVETPPKFNSNVDMATGTPSHRPKANVFQFQSVFFDT